jgi:hypothetical protein
MPAIRPPNKELSMRVRSAAAIALALAMFAPAGGSLLAQTKKNAPPLKGPIEVGYDMTAKREGDKYITIFHVKNISATGSIIGLQIDQYFYDKANQPLQGTGDRQRVKTPINPGEVVTITLTSNTVPGMQSPQHKFSYRDGTVKPKLMKGLVPTKTS